MRHKFPALVALGLLASFAPPVLCTPITYNFTASVGDGGLATGIFAAQGGLAHDARDDAINQTLLVQVSYLALGMHPQPTLRIAESL